MVDMVYSVLEAQGAVMEAEEQTLRLKNELDAAYQEVSFPILFQFGVSFSSLLCPLSLRFSSSFTNQSLASRSHSTNPNIVLK